MIMTQELSQTASLLDMITDDQLQAMREANKDDAAKVARVDAQLLAREEKRVQVELEAAFNEAMSTLELPLPPNTVYNVFRAMRKDSRAMTKKEREVYLAGHPLATTIELDSKRIELDTTSWGAWQVNKAMSVAGNVRGGGESHTTRKRAITLLERVGSTLEMERIGNFRTSSEAADHLGLDHEGNSAKRVLKDKGYTVDEYDGQDFLLSEK